MEFLAHAEVNGTTGRWIVTPRKGARFVGDAERRKARVRDRRRRVLVFLIEAIGISFLIGLVPPLRVVWNVTLALAILLGAYVWMLISMKHRTVGRSAGDACANARIRGDHAAAFAARYVIEGQNGQARERFNGLEGLARERPGARRGPTRSPPADGGPLRTRPFHPRPSRREERRPRAALARGASIDPRERERDPRDPSTASSTPRRRLIGESRAALDEGLAAVAGARGHPPRRLPPGRAEGVRGGQPHDGAGHRHRPARPAGPRRRGRRLPRRDVRRDRRGAATAPRSAPGRRRGTGRATARRRWRRCTASSSPWTIRTRSR